jgi:hypothetical protein
MLYWFVEGNDDNLTYIADFSYDAWRDKPELTEVELRKNQCINICAFEGSKVIDLRKIGRYGYCLDVTDVQDRTIDFVTSFFTGTQTFVVPQDVETEDALVWFSNHMVDINQYLPEGMYFVVYDAQQYVYPRRITPQDMSKIVIQPKVESKVEKVLAQLDAIVAAKDEEIAQLKSALAEETKMFEQCNDALTTSERKRRSLEQERNGSQASAQYWMESYYQLREERDNTLNQLSVHKQIVENLKNVMQLLEEV